jgi:hypothetical protein
MATLTQEERDALPESDFAVPGKRELPIHDEHHVKLAWDMVERTEDLTPEEKESARSRILDRAKKLGIDTKEWKKTEGRAAGPIHVTRRVEAMALDIPDVADHPNRAPFTGILVRLDEPSDYAVGGADGHKIVIPSEVAKAGLASLLGMAVDFKPSFDGHNPQSKIGIITSADVDGKELPIGGFFYAKDFPDEVAFIRKEKELLGFSYEADVRVREIDEDPWVLSAITFTGAAVLYKADAAYTTTSLVASASAGPTAAGEKGREAMAEKDVSKLIEEILGRVKALEDLGVEHNTAMQANKAVIDKIHPHAEAMKACAEAMRAEGIGLHAKRGHVAILHKMAAHMCAEAAMGRIPHEVPHHVFHDTDYMYASAADGRQGTEDGGQRTDGGGANEIKVFAEAIKTEIASLATLVKDIQAKAFENAASPGRKTISPEISALLNKIGLQAEADGTLKVEDVDRTLEAAGIKGKAAIEAKLRLMSNGMLPVGRTN